MSGEKAVAGVSGPHTEDMEMSIDPTAMPTYEREDGTTVSTFGLYRMDAAGLWDVSTTGDGSVVQVTDTRTGESFVLRRSAEPTTPE